jgi:flavorubredoxin
MITLFDQNGHKNVMFNDFSSGIMVQTNQHLVVHQKQGVILDPGGHKIYSSLFPAISSALPIDGLKYIFFSHQDPDILAAANGWLMVTDAEAFLSELWMRFIPHFGVDKLVIDRIKPIPDRGTTFQIGGCELKIVPAHFLHSCGNFQVYDPVAKILYTGDLGASLGNDYAFVEDFDSHVKYMEPFHRRYIPTSKALKMWAEMAGKMDIETIAPQHGAVIPGAENVKKFIDWVGTLECGLDLFVDGYAVP